MEKVSITAAILTHNEVGIIQGCLRTLAWCEKIIVLDHHSTDGTVELAIKAGAKVIPSQSQSFADRRNQLLTACDTEWILYIDADERVTPELATQIEQLAAEDKMDVGSLPRQNYFFGQQFHHGGWQGEMVTRLFRVSKLKGWQGVIHESPVFEGSVTTLQSPLWHFSHRSVVDGLLKTAHWTPMEATLLADQATTKVSIWTILRKGLGEIWRRGVRKTGWRDGTAGSLEVLTQAINRMLVYMQVWERQQTPSIGARYQELEKEVTELWQKKV